MFLLISGLLFSILLIMFLVSIFGILVYLFSMSKQYIRISVLSLIVCKSAVVYVYGIGDCVIFLLDVSLVCTGAHSAAQQEPIMVDLPDDFFQN
jgi:hypothetical protein